jgi:hypothetical protein
MPDSEAENVLKRIRAGADASTIVNQVRAGNVLIQMALTPETRYRYELPYRSEMPTDFLPNNPYLDSLLYESTSLYTDNTKAEGLGKNPVESAITTRDCLSDYRSLYLKPFHAAHVIEPLLSNAGISSWTSVCTDDTLMRDLLAHLFLCEYHTAAAFQKDWFLEDMAAQKHDFCSSLLVNVLLAYSCVR